MIPLANHLWQSTLFAAAAWLLTLTLRRNRAAIRYAIWLAASIKFLLPFSLLVQAGSLVEVRDSTAVVPPFTLTLDQLSRPFTPVVISAPLVSPTSPAGSFLWTSVLLAVWAAGTLITLSFWIARWRRLDRASRDATPLALPAPVPVRSTATALEPGVFGILRPVLLLPRGISDCLTPEQFQAVLAHEFCHLRRRDNLTAAIHMAVQSIFWFHPVLWWIGGRLVEERERACDEAVVRRGSAPEVYAAAILEVCRFYVESPLVCAAGVTGAGLRQRITAIMANPVLPALTRVRKLALAAAALAALFLPVVIGVFNGPLLRGQTPPPVLRFEVATIKPSKSAGTRAGMGIQPGGGIQVDGITLKGLIAFAYDVDDLRISGLPRWADSDRYDILAKPERGQSTTAKLNDFDRARLRTQSLLAERFELILHKGSKDANLYALVVAKDGPKLQPSKPDDERPFSVMRSATEINGKRAQMAQLVAMLTNIMGRPVIDRTGLTGKYEFHVEWPPDPASPAPSPDHPGARPDAVDVSVILGAIEKQLGLKVEAQRGALETVVVDSVKKPSAN